MSQSPREASPLFEGLPFLDWPRGRERAQVGKEFQQGHSLKAGLLACPFKSQVIWEAGGSVLTAPARSQEELLRRSQQRGSPSSAQCKNLRAPCSPLWCLRETPQGPREAGD